MSTSPALWTRKQLAKWLDVSERTVERLDVKGDGPGFLRLGRLVRYDPDVCRAWASARAYPHRAAEAARGSTSKNEKAPVTG